MKRALGLVVAGSIAAAAVLGALEAGAQRLDPRRPTSLVVGPPRGPSPTQRVDGRRSGASPDPLPTRGLRVAWRQPLGFGVDQAALTGAGGEIAVVTNRGDVYFLDASGKQRAHVTVPGRTAGPATRTSDGTVVFATSTGEAIGITPASSDPKFVTNIGAGRSPSAAPLALDDGGVVLATRTDLVVLDSSGRVRARTTLPEVVSGPLLSDGREVLAVGVSGAVYGWKPGREPVRLGSFGAPVDGGAGLSGPRTLVAVIEGNHLVDLDLGRGTRATRAVAAQGLYLGPPALRLGKGGATATLLAMTPTRGYVVTVSPSGQELLRAPVASFTAKSLPDGGPAPLVAPSHRGPLVDARGAIAFAGPDGRVGVIAPDGAAAVLGEHVCSPSARSSGVAGLAPAGPRAFVVTCESGAVVKVDGPG